MSTAAPNSWYVYVGPVLDEQHTRDTDALKSYPVLCFRMDGEPHDLVLDVRRAVRVLTNERAAGLLLPDDFRRHTKDIERVKACAHQMGLPVMPVTRFLHDQTTPATVAAVPANQQPAVVG